MRPILQIISMSIFRYLSLFLYWDESAESVRKKTGNMNFSY